MKTVSILDSTLREGTQCEGISFSDTDKINILHALDNLGIHFAECGFPVSNERDLRFYSIVKQERFKQLNVVPFGNTCRKNTEASGDSGLIALSSTQMKYVSIFGKASLLHVDEVLKVPPKENLRMISDSVNFLCSKGHKVFFDAEHFFDGFKIDKNYALSTLLAAKNAGAEIIVLCDTNGGAYPEDIAYAMDVVKEKLGDTKIGIHCHNDCGLAIINTISAVKSGAYQAQCTIGGIGERCGNADLSVLIPNLQIKLNYNVIDKNCIKLLTPITRYLFELINISFNSRTPFVGYSAFAHKGGMHIDGVIKNTSTFEHIKPETVGNQRRFLISSQSGKTSVYNRLKNLLPWISKDGEEVAKVTNMLKTTTNLGYSYENADASFDLDALNSLGLLKEYFKVIDFHTLTASSELANAAHVYLKVSVDGNEEINAAEGDGPVNAIDMALRKALRRFYPSLENMYLSDFKVRVINKGGTASVVRVLIESTDGKQTWTTVGVSPNIIYASLKALEDSAKYYLFKNEN